MYKIFSHHICKWKLLLLAGDVVVFCFSVLIGFCVNPMIDDPPLVFVAQHQISLLLVGVIYLTVIYIGDLYDYYQDFRLLMNVARVVFWALIGTILVLILFYVPFSPFIGRHWIVRQSLAFAGLLALWRYAFSAIALPVRLRRQILIVGAGKAGHQILEAIRRRPHSGWMVVGFIDDDPRKIGTHVAGIPVLGDSQRLDELVRELRICLVVVAITYEKSPALVKALTRLSLNGCQLTDMPGFYEFLTGKIPIDHISHIWLFLHSLHNKKLYYRRVKRLLDLGLVTLGLALTWPLFGLIALAIKLDSSGPVFFRQDRLGQDAKPFQIIKFRTMEEDAERHGPRWACFDDPRVTRVGRILRMLRLDELPQLINILKGEMSFIGPRPEREVFVQEFQELMPVMRPGRRASDPPGTMVICGYKELVPYYSYRLLVKPGITGWAQVRYPYASSLAETKEKLQYDLYYIKNMGFFLDLAILLKTVRIVLFGRGI